MTSSLITLLCLFLTISLINAVPCPFAEECDCKYLTKVSVDAYCTDVAIFPVFDKTNIDITFLSIEGNFTLIPTNAFKTVDTHIGDIYFQRSARVEQLNLEIKDDAFLTGPNGMIEAISFYDFEDLLALPDDLGGANGLKFLQLHRCGVEVIKNNSFNGTTLTELDISNGHLRLIEEDAFVGIEDTLTHLQLDNNKFTEVPTVIRSLNKINGIYLDGNNITEIPDDAFPPQVTTIDLSNNPLSTFTTNPFREIVGLSTLELNNCSLTEVPTVLYGDNFKTVQHFRISDNQIKEINGDSFPKATFENMPFMPDLDNNPIESFTGDAFSGLINVGVAQFNGLYRLETVDFDIFASMTSLQSISFSNCRMLVNVTLMDATKLPSYLTAIKVTESKVILNFDPTFGVWMRGSTNNELTLSDDGFRCDEELKWMNEFLFCAFHPRITLDRSKCDKSDLPIEKYLFQQFDNNCM